MNIVFSWIAYARGGDENDMFRIIRLVFLNSLFFFAYAYLTSFVLVPWLLSRSKYLGFIFLFIVTGFIISYLKFVFSDYMFHQAISSDLISRMQAVSIAQLLVNTKDMTFIVAIFLIAKFAKDNHHMKNKIRELQERQIESEITLLKNQMDPHVIFNNLNNLYSISLNKPGEVAVHVKMLNELMYYYFREGKGRTVELKKELDAIRNYLGLEKLRYGDRLFIDYKIEGNLEGKKLIPFILFSFVENCIEHGCSTESGDSWLNISAQSKERELHFYAANSKPADIYIAEQEKNQGSLENIRRKLELYYPGKYSLNIQDERRRFVLDLILKI